MVALGRTLSRIVLFSKQAIRCLRCFNNINPASSKFLIKLYFYCSLYLTRKKTYNTTILYYDIPDDFQMFLCYVAEVYDF